MCHCFVVMYFKNGKVVNNNTYTPQPSDRSGINLTCTDIEHPNWNQIDIFAYRFVQSRGNSVITFEPI